MENEILNNIAIGQFAFEYLMNNLIVIWNGDLMFACAPWPGMEEVMCQQLNMGPPMPIEPAEEVLPEGINL